MATQPAIFTIGHSTNSVEELVALLRRSGVVCVVDVRTIRRSRANPQFNEDRFPAELARHGLEYVTMPALGGLRGRQPKVDSGVNGFWENASFHRYADYALSEAFRSGLEELRTLAHTRPCALMCAEVLWWRCHRRIIADYLLQAGESVYHILPGKVEVATLTRGARPQENGQILYPAPA